MRIFRTTQSPQYCDGSVKVPVGKKEDSIYAIQAVHVPKRMKIIIKSKIDAAVIDGAASINMLKPTNTVKTFKEYADQVFITYLKGQLQLQHVQRVDIICTKQFKSNYQGVCWRVQCLTTVTKHWKEFLRVDTKKKELVSFLPE